MRPSSKVLYTVILMQACSIVRISSFPHHATNDDMEIITVEEIAHSPDETNIPTASLITRNNDCSSAGPGSISIPSAQQNDASNEPTTIDIADDLIFLAERTQHNAAEQLPPTTWTSTSTSTIVQLSPVGTSQQIDLITSAEEDSLTAALDSALAPFKSSEEQQNASESSSKSKSTKVSVESDGDAPVGRAAVATTPQNELRTRHVSADNTENNDDNGNNDDIVETTDDVGDCDGDGVVGDGDGDGEGEGDSEELDMAPSVEPPITPIDMSDFVTLIPAATVKSIAANYYLNDPEVQRAYAYLNSRDFMVLRQHIIEQPEVKAFLRYLNNSGLNVVAFLNTLTNLTSKPDELPLTDDSMADIGSGSDAILLDNEIGNELEFSQITTTISSVQSETLATTERQLNGLHGLVDSILDTLPQDQILATFFDKLESNEQFAKLVESISRPAFAKILQNMQNSPQLRILVFKLHNNGIYITRIVDSMKAYFFLGTF